MGTRPGNDPRISSRTRQRRARDSGRAPAAEAPAGLDESRPNEVLNLGGWLAALELKQAAVAKDAGITKSYMNNLVNPKKGGGTPNPSVLVMLRISRAMGVTINHLYSPPPSKAQIAAIARLKPAHLAAGIGMPES